MFALKPYAECVGNQKFSVQEMGTCRLVFNSEHVDDVVIVVYTQNEMQQQDDRSNRGGRPIILPVRFQQDRE